MSVPGYLYDVEGDTLQRLAAGNRVLEIGSFQGRSTIAMAYSAQYVTAVEHFQGDDMASPTSAGGFLDNVAAYSAQDKVTLIQDDFFQLSNPYRATVGIDLRNYDFVFYDAKHEPSPYERDFFEIVLDYMALQGVEQLPRIVAIHDYKPDEEAFRFTVEAADWFTEVTGSPMLGNRPENGSLRWWEVSF